MERTAARYEDRDFDAVSGGWRMSFGVDFKQLWHSSFADEPKSSNHVGFKEMLRLISFNR